MLLSPGVSNHRLIVPLKTSLRFAAMLNADEKSTGVLALPGSSAKKPAGWKRVSLLQRLYHRGAQVMILALTALGIAKAIPLPSSYSEARTSMVNTIEDVTAPLCYLAYGMIGEMMLYMVLSRKRIILSHETGHTLGYYQMQEQLKAALSDYAAQGKREDSVDTSAIELSGPVNTFLNVTGSGKASMLTRRLDAFVTHLLKETEAMVKDGSLYRPENAQKRATFIQMIRLNNMTTVAGPMLEGYLMGRRVPFSSLSDIFALWNGCQLLAIVEKPESEWSAPERKPFLERAKADAYREAEVMITSLDRNKVDLLIQQMLSESRQGKTIWSGEEMMPRLSALFNLSE